MKAQLRRGLQELALASGWSSRRAAGVGRPRILMYYRPIAEGALPPAVFEAQLAWLKRHTELLPLRELLDRLEAGRCNGHEVALTFDDGLENHAEVVWPLLRRERVPATIFVCPGLAELQGCVWNLELRLRWNSLALPQRQALAGRLGLPSAGDEALIVHAKRLGLAQRRALEAQVQAATPDWHPSERDRPRIRAMGWAALRAMDPALIDFGCQSMTHPILTHLDEAEAQVEIVDSRRLLEERLQRPVDTFVYPNGDADAAVFERVAAHYRAGFSSSPGFADAAAQRTWIDRIPAAEDMARFLWRMHRPGW